MINFELLENNVSELRDCFRGVNIEHFVLDNFLIPDSLKSILEEIPSPDVATINKSRDYIFAKNKFEKSSFDELGPHMKTLKEQLLSHRFSKFLIEPLANRCVIMFTRDYTLHGYDAISFPDGQYRRSIAAYGYTLVEESDESARSTVWYPEQGSLIKRFIGRSWPKLVALKHRFAKSGTSKNR